MVGDVGDVTLNIKPLTKEGHVASVAYYQHVLLKIAQTTIDKIPRSSK